MAEFQYHIVKNEKVEFDLSEFLLPDNPEWELRYAASSLKKERVFRVRDLPREEQPRERLSHYGPKTLSTTELLAILLGSGNHSQSAIQIAQAILATISSSTDGEVCKALQKITANELQHISGVGPAKAAAIVAAIELGKRVFAPTPLQGTIVDDPSVAAEAFSRDLMWENQEKFAVLHLDIKHRLLSVQVITVGSATETLAHPQDVFRSAIERRATRIIVAHNHPSGSIEPSMDDLELSKQLIESGKILGIPVLDHLILGDGNFVSLRQTTKLWERDAP